MLENLTQRLSRVVKGLRGQARLTDDNIQDALREVRLALLEADVALPVVREFVAVIKEKAVGEEVVGSLTPGQIEELMDRGRILFSVPELRQAAVGELLRSVQMVTEELSVRLARPGCCRLRPVTWQAT